MELHSLKPANGAVKKGKRIARGQGSGHGGTATKGHKGDKARSGHKLSVTLKEVRCHYKCVCQKWALKIQTG